MTQVQFFCLLSGIYIAPHMSYGWALVVSAINLAIAVCIFFAERK
jgi:hypothetical protein